ncbi:FHA domain-containing protein [Caldimonas tepidiphila]|uniref:FHA domain-containing protein n=1 Tax=Caldimonas tepidiphila TaxID=2315841 RepID=UPI000E5B1E07|nr:FHA domain-containing protein [Caldimonas tepidiphila]
MPLKTWILDKMNRVSELFVREDLPPRAEPRRPGAALPSAGSEPRRDAAPPALPGEHLGAYAPLIDAIRDELERFVAAHVRLHLAIAEHDRFLLTSIGIEADEGGEPLELLRRFTREFRPEQIRRFLMRELVAGLPNAGAIDLSQFSGLKLPAPGQPADEEEDGDEYAELLKALGAPAGADASAYRVSLVGRWTEGVPPPPEARGASPAAAATVGATPLAGARVEADLHDAHGERRVALPPVLPGRRLVVGKDAGCDLVVEGTYTSRRHCEIWLEGGVWRVMDTGSTNGIRVESAAGVRRGGGREGAAGAAPQAIEFLPGERIVLSALAQGEARDYPWFALRPPPPAAPATPLAAVATPATPITPVVMPAPAASPWSVTLLSAGGERTLALDAAALPASVGRSRSRTLVVDRAHESVSGHHLDIVALDEAGAELLVHGTNGVTLDGVAHPPGARLRWPPGRTLQLGRPGPQEPPCLLRLMHRGDTPR